MKLKELWSKLWPTKKITLNKKTLADLIIAECMQDVGKTESQGANRSALIDAICKFFGLPMGQPYCIGGILYRVDQVLKKHNLKNPLVMTMSTQSFWNGTASKYKVVKGSLAKRGMIGIQRQRTNKAKGHAYLMLADEVKSKVQQTLEYNTNNAGSREGDGVWIRTRTQEGTTGLEYLGSVDIVQMIADANGIKE